MFTTRAAGFAATTSTSAAIVRGRGRVVETCSAMREENGAASVEHALHEHPLARHGGAAPVNLRHPRAILLARAASRSADESGATEHDRATHLND